MSDKPTDFNDQANQQGTAQLASDLKADLSAINEAKQQQSNEVAQPVVAETQDKSGNSQPPPPESTPTNAPRRDEDWRDLMEVNKDGGYKASVRNTELVLRYDEHWLGVLGYCQLSYRVVKHKPPPMPDSESGEWKDEDAAALKVWMAHQYGFTPSHGDIADALIVVARSFRFHPVRDYLHSLIWDGVPRLDTWLKDTFCSTDDERYLGIVGPRILIAAVARVMKPGCKADNVMILEGEQGRGKSTIISILFGEWFSDSPMPIGDKEAYQLIHGKWGWELAELDSFHKAEITILKQFFSQQVDRFRPAYGRHAQDHPRQTQFWGTTNQDAYLRDYTGNRRFWPLYCVVVNKDWVREHRDQLWAEALHRYKKGEQFWVSTDENDEDFKIVKEAQDARLQRDPWEDMLRPWLESQTKPYLTTAEILKDCIGLDGAHMQQVHMNRLGPIMRALGWRSKREWLTSKTGKRSQIRVWKSESVQKQLDEVPL